MIVLAGPNGAGKSTLYEWRVALDFPHYAFDRFGELCFHNSAPGRRHGSEPLAICFTPEDGVLFKHGPETSVRFHYDRLRAIEPEAQLIVFPMDVLRSDEGGAILAEINACLACSGRVAQIAERLMAL